MTRVLLLSPHPDDLAWSLGGTLARLRGELSAVTFFGRTRYAPGHPAHGSDTATAVRAVEEDAWAAWAGVRLLRHDLPDASLRGFTDETEMGAAPEPEVVTAVSELLCAALGQATDVVFAPLAVGGHVDHEAVRLACSTVDVPVVWYEDLPYALGSGGHGHRSVVAPVAWDVKETGVRFFPSQEPDEVLPVLRAHERASGGERLWTSAGLDLERLVAVDRVPVAG
ncbi:PIG-L deacetylase family protein [Actinokineospora diospyrosa]|uniref:N-acetylglucosaminyl deacetylase, LmbE family n=1 Tax=Actinokineospora diospyrosa TaxID=103728 RepID=A0ABT1IIS6_9PSEU|nr:PIG-L family deacetylase [Actinokineospora diospyrosa]MCP2272562.1 N-acetylglucosaminyl deacetylase, LmbE family [Actinokineospora diospyrosa]